jgi:toxin YoeB
MLYKVRYTPEANIGLAKLERDEPKAFAKVQRFIEELREHPKTGTGHPEPLKGQPEGLVSLHAYSKLIYRMAS